MYIISRCQYHDIIIDVHVFDAVSCLYVILSQEKHCVRRFVGVTAPAVLFPPVLGEYV